MFKLFDLYIKSSIHVSIAVTAFAYVTCSVFQISGSPALYFFIFSSTLVSYNFTKYIVLFRNDTVSATGLVTKIAGITGLALAGGVWSAFYLDFHTLSASLLLGIITLFYGMPVLRRRSSLRHIYGIKILVIAFVWAGVTVFLPVLDSQASGSIGAADLLTEFLQRFLYVIVLTLPFDIRDLHTDTPGLGTIPQLVGVRQTKILGSGLLLSVFTLEAIQGSVTDPSFFVLCLILFLTGMAVWRSVKIQPANFASFWVEGLPILWAVLLYLF